MGTLVFVLVACLYIQVCRGQSWIEMIDYARLMLAQACYKL
jgi:hypothetical protein